jgi:Chaperone of endosialidase
MKSRALMYIVPITLLAALALPVRPVAQVTGSGTPGNIPVWTGSSSPSNTLGNSTVIQTPASSTTGTGMQVNSGRGRTALCRSIVGDGPECISGTAGGSIQITAAGGGASACLSSVCGKAGNGGSISLQPGGSGFGSGTLAGKSGNVILVPNFGRVGVGLIPGHTFEVKIGGTTLADAWTIRSSRIYKTNIQPLSGALDKVERLRGVSYQRKVDNKLEIGVVAEEVEPVVPEVVSRDPQTNEIQGIDYSPLAALLIEAVKAQQQEIEQLKAKVEQLSKSSH